MTYVAFMFSVAILTGSTQIRAFTEEIEFIDYPDQYNDGQGQEDDEERFDPIESIFPNLETVCKINARASDEDVQFVLDNCVPETRVQKCFVACWLERLQIVRKDKIRQDRYLEVASYDYKDNLRRIDRMQELLDECKYSDAGMPERCELAYLITKCVHDAAVGRGWDPKQY